MTEKPTWSPLFASDYSYKTPFNLFRFVRDSVVNKFESWDFFLSGDRGMGKSACAMSLAKMLDPNFTVSHWAFTADRFIELITTRHPPGTCIVFDDVGTAEGSSSRKWNSEGAHTLSDVMQINRTDSLITIGTSLQLSRMELRLREGFRVLCQPIKKLTAKQTGYGMAIDVEMRLRTADVFDDSVRYKLWRYCQGGRIKYVRLFHPPAPMWREYQITRKDFLEHLKSIRAEKAAAAAERKEKKDHNAVEKSLKATDKEWAHEIHVNPMQLSVYRNLLKAVRTDGSKELIRKPDLITLIATTTQTQPSTSEAKIRKLVTAGVLSQVALFDQKGRRKSYEYDVTEKGRAMIDNMAIQTGD